MKTQLRMKGFVLFIMVVLVLSGCGAKPSSDQKNQIPAGSNASGNVPANAPKSWSKPPEMKIDPKKSYQAVFTTSKGKFTVELFAKDAPKTVNNFVFLAQEGFYNHVTFHRIIKSFMIQTGDPLGTGRGGPGYKFEDELKTPYKYEPGIVAMANSGPNTNGSQFFICTGDSCKNLNSIPKYTIFGKVIEGMDTVQKIDTTPVKMNPNSNDQSPSLPTEPVTIESVTITEK